jgi:hypothetical protein
MNRKKSKTKYRWKSLGINFLDEEFEFIYGVYENIDNCMLCSNEFKNSFDKCLDHNHSTGEVRYILCRNCNFGYDRKENTNNKLGEKNISETTIKGNEFYVIQKKKNGKRLFNKYFNKNKYSLNEVIKIRDELII